jgi:chemotaxis protein MotA
VPPAGHAARGRTLAPKLLPPRMLLRSGPAGAALATATLVAVLAAATGFLQPASLLITVGGALAVTAVTFSRQRLESTWHHLAEALADPPDDEGLVTTLKRLARIHRLDGPRALEAAAADAEPLVRHAIRSLLECRDEDELCDVLTGEARMRAAEGEAARHVLMTLARLFPAWGLIGTLIGLALLLRGLGSGGIGAVGPGLGVAVLTTLYGAVLSNVVMLPLATRLQAHLARTALRTQMVMDGVRLVYRKEFPTRVERVLRAHLGSVAAELPPDVVRLAEHAA